MSEGKDVRAAFDGPSIDHDELLDFIEARNREDKQRASSAGESRQKIGAYLEETSMNSKALGWCRQIIKTNEKDGGQHKAMDIITSMEVALPMIKAHVAGQGTTEMEFDVDDEPSGDGFTADDFVNDAFGRGAAAYEAGVLIDGNPFDPGSEMAHHQLWIKGWEEARDEDIAASTADDLDDDTIEALGAEMDADLEEVENVARPHFGGAA